jgi:two-component system nitrogen regulation sensor histidine kinase GlnL
MSTRHPPASQNPEFSALDLISSAIVLTHDDGRVIHVNAAAELLFEISLRQFISVPLANQFENGQDLAQLIGEASRREFSRKRLEMHLRRLGREPLALNCVVSTSEMPGATVVFEFQEIDQQLRVSREERLSVQNQMNKELIRNLAHEIKNPLGGIRGAAQLLEAELPSAELREYTQVVIKEADRLQLLVDRLLAPHRRPHTVGDVNIHEVLERVRSVLLAQYPHGLTVQRDYDTSLPEFRGDKEQLIQAVLNIAQNAAQALEMRIRTGDALIRFTTRVVRQITLQKTRYRLALDLHITDNGPGVAPAIREQIFYPLVSGREGGSGLGLTLAQTFVEQHYGTIECESEAGRTDFQILIPLP